MSRVNHLSGAVLAAGLAVGLLSGCGRHHVAPAQETSAPVSRPDALAGAPSDVPPPPPPSVLEAPPVPPPPERPGDRDVIYDLGPVVHPHDAMAPIPNPTEPTRLDRHIAYKRSAASRPHHATHRGSVAGRRAAPPPHRAPPPARTAPRAATKPIGEGKASPAVKPAHPAVVASAARRRPAQVAPSRAKAHEAARPNAAKPTSATTGERTEKLSALQSSLREAVHRSAVLTAPELKAGQPAEVTLTMPADFASVVRNEAGKQKLTEAAASVNMTALLAGDGYAVAPDETQSQPLTIGQPTEFHWTVTAQPGAHGPLHADIGADLLGGGDSALQLGSVSPGGGGVHVSPRAWGAALLVLLAIVVFAWLSRGRRGPARRAPRPANTRGLYERPLDMGTSTSPPPVDRER